MNTTRNTKITTRLAGAAAALALVAGACGSDDDAADDTPVESDAPADTSGGDTMDTEAPMDTEAMGTEAPADGDASSGSTCDTAPAVGGTVASLSELDFSGLDVNVGSKDFVEQFVLGSILVVALEETGATVTDNTNLGGTVVNREALLADEIDTYWEYNGTGYAVHLGISDDVPGESEVLTTETCATDLEQNNIRWIGQTPFNDTYGFATGPDFEGGQDFDLQGMADYLGENQDATVCLETEFPNRPDGLVLFEDATGYVVPQDQLEILETGVIYEQTATGECDFGEIFTTDGRIPALELNVVEDPGVFIIYNASLTMGDALYQENPEGWQQLVNTIVAPLDADTMAELNRQVSADGEQPIDVARTYLTDQGLI